MKLSSSELFDLVRLNGNNIIANRNATLVGVDTLSEVQGRAFDKMLDQYLADNGIYA